MNVNVKIIGSMAFGLLTGVVASNYYHQSAIDEQNRLVAKLQTQLQDNKANSSGTTSNKTYAPPNKLEEAVSIIFELEGKVAELSAELVEKERQVAQGKAQSTLAQVQTEDTAALASKLRSPEFVRESVLPAGVLPVVGEISSQLKLSKGHSERLSKLLQAKAEADYSVINQYQKRINESADDADLFETEQWLTRQLTKNAEDYEGQLGEFMSDQQIEDYREFENDKHRQQYAVDASLVMNEMNRAIGDLTDYQRQEVEKLLDSNGADIQSHGLGAIGSPYSGTSTTAVPRQEQLEMILTPEQLQQYYSFMASGAELVIK